VLPDRFVKIRYYGFMRNAVRRKNIALCRERLQVEDHTREDAKKKEAAADLMLELTGIDIHRCPHCKKGRMVRRMILSPTRNHSPPAIKGIS